MEVIDISSLNARYGINRNAVNDRIHTLNIKRSKRGKISPEDLVLMDKYHEHIQRGGTILNFPISPDVVIPGKVLDVVTNDESIAAMHYATGALYCLADAIASIKVEYNPIKNMQLLQESADKGYILSTKQIKELCGVKPSHDQIYGKFRFIKADNKVGKSFGWKVIDIKLRETIEKFRSSQSNIGVVVPGSSSPRPYWGEYNINE